MVKSSPFQEPTYIQYDALLRPKLHITFVIFCQKATVWLITFTPSVILKITYLGLDIMEMLISLTAAAKNVQWDQRRTPQDVMEGEIKHVVAAFGSYHTFHVMCSSGLSEAY